MSSFLLVFLMLKCYRIKAHITEGPDTPPSTPPRSFQEMKVFNPLLTNEKGQKWEERGAGTGVLTRAPLGPGLPCGPADPCNKEKTVEEQLLSHLLHTWSFYTLRGKLDSASWSETRDRVSWLPVWSCQDLKLYFTFSHLNSWQHARTMKTHQWADFTQLCIPECLFYIFSIFRFKWRMFPTWIRWKGEGKCSVFIIQR